MFISRRWRRSWRIPGRWWFRGVDQQLTKRDCTTKRARAKNFLYSRESCLFPTCYLPVTREYSPCYGPVPRNETPRCRTGSGGRSTASCDLRGGPAPRRRPVGAAPVRPAGGCEKFLAKVIFCAMFVLSGPSHGRTSCATDFSPSPSAMGLRRGLRTRARSCSNPLKTLKTAMGRPCNKLA